MLHARPHGHWPIKVPEKIFLKCLAWQPFWSFDPDTTNNSFVPRPIDAVTYNIDSSGMENIRLATSRLIIVSFLKKQKKQCISYD